MEGNARVRAVKTGARATTSRVHPLMAEPTAARLGQEGLTRVPQPRHEPFGSRPNEEVAVTARGR